MPRVVPTLLAAPVAAALGLALAAGPAAGSDGVVTVPGLDFPDSYVRLAYAGCDDYFSSGASAPLTRINRGPGPVPLGERSFGFELDQPGTVAGPAHRVDSLVDTTVAEVRVAAGGGARGAAYVWYAGGDLAEGQSWSGRAELSAPAGGWTNVSAAGLSFAWTARDMATGAQVLDGGTATVAEFTAAHGGDGPGWIVLGFGCGGTSFNIDGFRVGGAGGVTTYDFEGMVLSTAIEGPTQPVRAGQEVTISGATRDFRGQSTGQPMVLEARAAGTRAFVPVGEPVQPGDDGTARVTLEPQETTDYRWRTDETEYAEGTLSAVLSVTVEPVVGEPARPAARR
ncbi:hypothetical protein [Nocardioides pacificus]